MIETGEDLRAAREKLGWSVGVMARALKLAGDRDQAVKRLIEMEAGFRSMSGPLAVAVEGFLKGFVPEHIERE
ncbi:MAG: hypothetical protein ABIO39_08725 [Caulobacteraceae bacterium]